VSQHKIKAIITRKTNFGDNDIIFDVLSDEGKIIGFFARGARKIKSRFSGVLQLGIVVNITYTTGKNLNYPNEISLDTKNLFSFYTRSLEHMNFYTDIITILKAVSKDLEDRSLFEMTIDAFSRVQNSEDPIIVYNDFLNNILELIGVATELRCNVSGEEINEPEFYYIPESNRLISEAEKPKSLDLLKISFDKVFYKQYLQKLIYEHVHQKLKLKF
jgi:DNA repair protein RecO